MGEPRIDAPRAVDQLAWWVQHGEELRLENEQLRRELDWWQQSFVCRFGPNNLPHVGDPLLGHRFHLFYEGKDGELVKWQARPGRSAYRDGQADG
jgi:hypothetical protein